MELVFEWSEHSRPSPRVPLDLCFMIIRHFVGQTRTTRPCERPFSPHKDVYRTTTGEILPVMLVSRTWKAIAEPMLFERFGFSRPTSDGRFLRALKRQVGQTPASQHVVWAVVNERPLRKRKKLPGSPAWRDMVKSLGGIQELWWNPGDRPYPTPAYPCLLEFWPTTMLKTFFTPRPVTIPFKLFMDFLLASQSLEVLDAPHLVLQLLDEPSVERYLQDIDPDRLLLPLLRVCSLKLSPITCDLLCALTQLQLPSMRTLRINLHIPEWDELYAPENGYGVPQMKHFLRTHGSNLLSLELYSAKRDMRQWGDICTFFQDCPAIEDLILDLPEYHPWSIQITGKITQLRRPTVRRLGLRFMDETTVETVQGFGNTFRTVFPNLQLIRSIGGSIEPTENMLQYQVLRQLA